ncbi:MAG: hypothetical protein KDB14_04880 [Planctomycetales bacterium]|nr:hypothetical protein [Planctomycetales bacterium]MCA9227682.1 hypothetical protein [Planctomycetales bacterium]
MKFWENSPLERRISAGQIPLAEAEPCFAAKPGRMLAAYRADRRHSGLAKQLALAKQLRARCRDLVVLGARDSLQGAKALTRSCQEPGFVGLPASERGGRPRLHFVDERVDNDSLTGLLRLLASGGDSAPSWTLIETAEVAERHAPPPLRWASQVLRTRGADEPLRLAPPDSPDSPYDTGPLAKLLSDVTLISATAAGVNVIGWLEGQRDAFEAFQANDAACPVRRLAAARRLAKDGSESWHAWRRALEPWLRLLAPSIGAAARPGLVIHVAARNGREDSLQVSSTSAWDELERQRREARYALEEANDQPAVELELPDTSEHSLGQLVMCCRLSDWLACSRTSN